jgi:hypothetical protein
VVFTSEEVRAYSCGLVPSRQVVAIGEHAGKVGDSDHSGRTLARVGDAGGSNRVYTAAGGWSIKTTASEFSAQRELTGLQESENSVYRWHRKPEPLKNVRSSVLHG